MVSSQFYIIWQIVLLLDIIDELDVAQAAVGWTGCMAVSFYMIKNFPSAPPPSIGFPDYIYPDDAACEMYDGVPCSQDASLCCYNTEKWCPDDLNCTIDNGGEMSLSTRSNPAIDCYVFCLTLHFLLSFTISIPHWRPAFVPQPND